MIDMEAICTKALSLYGAAAQTLMCMEEMAELQKELCKNARGRNNFFEIAEEIADVQIMLEQMMILHKCREAVEDWKAVKLLRLQGMLNNKEEEREHDN